MSPAFGGGWSWLEEGGLMDEGGLTRSLLPRLRSFGRAAPYAAAFAAKCVSQALSMSVLLTFNFSTTYFKSNDRRLVDVIYSYIRRLFTEV